MRVVKMHQFLSREKREYTLSGQILRSGTSIGANIAECEFAFSKKDFLAKIYIALKECGETIYWLGILRDGGYISDKMYQSMYDDCAELLRMMQSITKTIRTEKPSK